MAKPVVLFDKVGVVLLGDGRAFLQPLNHPDSANVSNTKPVITSKVIRVLKEDDKIIELETENTIYKQELDLATGQ